MLRNAVKTGDLLMILKNTEDISSRWQELREDMDAPSFSEYLHGLITERGIDTAKFGVKTLISRSFAYQILSGTRIPSRDIILRICVAIGCSVDETQRLLMLADRGALYPKVERDAAIIYCLSNGYDLYRADEFLSNLKLRQLL